MLAGHVILLVDHGSRLVAANAATEKLGQQLNQELDWAEVLTTHMELAEPSYQGMLKKLAAGTELVRLTVIPLFFVAGTHIRDDIEAPLLNFRQLRPDVQVEMLPPFVEQPNFRQYLKLLLQT